MPDKEKPPGIPGAFLKRGAPDGIRTHGPQIRNLVLYPAELRAPLPGLLP